MTDRLRAIRRARHEADAVRRAARLARAADGPLAALVMFAAGMAHATPRRWGSGVLAALGIERLILRPARLGGGVLAVDPADSGHTCVVEECFVPPVAYDLSLVEFEPAAIIDCGAHIGVFSLLAHRRFPGASMTAFEPNPRNVEWLRDNLRRNAATAIEAVAAAVSATAGHSLFRVTPHHSESGQLSGEGARGGADGLVDVTVVDLPAFVLGRAPASLLLKLDIEGEEERLLPALRPVLPRRCAIFFETHRGAEGWEAARGGLAADGFSVRVLRQRDQCYDGFAVRA